MKKQTEKRYMDICYECEQKKLEGIRGCKEHLPKMLKLDKKWEMLVRKSFDIPKAFQGLPETITSQATVRDTNMKKTCKHRKVELLTIQWEFPNNLGIQGTTVQQQYAYFTCRSCGDCVKKEVKPFN